MPSLTVENYLKAIYQLGAAEDNAVATGKLAAALGVSPGTVTSMLKTLRDGELVTYAPYEGVLLTPSGRNLALRVLRRHRLIELFLSKTLGLSWDEVHEEAEHMEHAVSDRLIDRIDDFLGRPQADPHGDPIPRADGTLQVVDYRHLAECPKGYRFRLARVLDQSPEFLRYLSGASLELGCEGEVAAHRPEAGVITILVAGQPTTLALDAAAKILVASR